MRKKDVIEVRIKEPMDIMAKIYLSFIIFFVLFVAYIVIYRTVNREQVIENIKNTEIQQQIRKEKVMEEYK